MDEREAIARLKGGDIGGLETLVRRHQWEAVRVALLITRDRQLAEDIPQEAFTYYDVGRSPAGRYRCRQ